MNLQAPLAGTALPPPLAHRLDAELQPGELLVWTGQPSPTLARTRARKAMLLGLLLLIPAAFITLVILILEILLAITHSSPVMMAMLFPGPLIALGGAGYFIAAPWRAQQLALRTAYALTNQRAILFVQRRARINAFSFAPSALDHMRRTEFPDGSGDLIFRESLTTTPDGHAIPQLTGFFSLPHVQSVESLIRATLLTPR